MFNSAKILVVDDIPANLEVITEILSSVGYQVVTSISGERALNRLQSLIPNLILLDIQMPGLDGFETCERIKNNPELAHIPIIFITALSDTESIVKGFSLGAVDYISKPFREPELVARVNTHLQIQQMNQMLEQKVAERTHELKVALTQLQDSQVQLIQQEKMSALGNLVAGIAHEINNPLGFLVGNIKPIVEYVQDLLDLIDLFLARTPQLDASLASQIETIELDFIRQDLPQLFASMKLGIERLRDISQSLRTFSRIDQETKVSFNLHEGIESTLLILKHRLKAQDTRPEIEIIKDYGNLPELNCFPGQLSQVFINILANAIDALEERNQGKSYQEIQALPNHIKIKTLCSEDQIHIHINDNGVGMTEAVRKRIFDHLYTTKDVGKGTGLGLAIARQIMVENHGGSIEVHSEINQGTEFILSLPIT